MRLLFVFVFLLGLVSCGEDKKSSSSSSSDSSSSGKPEKQPNCEDVNALHTCDDEFIPSNYSGFVKCCNAFGKA